MTEEEKEKFIRDMVGAQEAYIRSDIPDHLEPDWPGLDEAIKARLSDSWAERVDDEESITFLLERARAFLKPTSKKGG